ncbi:hypothetical protein [Conexibacter sp. SYSU D00693]|uniref:hypothetical protein n=1 Tax=Conexibacter sp. SYSU D00693 TaxID=2812560 RepID=UPI00196B1472|nr:hypothetical protein [Conexibacter sp. SYSU D00693]
MGAADDIFPSHQSPAFVQTRWSEGWGYAVIGFGSAARMLTEQRAKMHASVDQIGLAIFFLQRHRVELVLKHALVLLGEDVEAVAKLPHRLDVLWRRFGQVVRPLDPKGWRYLEGEFGDFVEAIHKADEGSFTYRYPVNREGEESKRAPFIDLDALERYAERFDLGISGFVDWIDEGRREAEWHNQP